MNLHITIASVLILTSLAACMHPVEQAGENMHLQISIQFSSAENKPLAGQEAYIIETLGNSHSISAIVEANEEGIVYLEGYYCLPVIVAIDGGEVIIKKNQLLSRYSVVINDNHLPTLVQMYGFPIPGEIKEEGTRLRPQHC